MKSSYLLCIKHKLLRLLLLLMIHQITRYNQILQANSSNPTQQHNFNHKTNLYLSWRLNFLNPTPKRASKLDYLQDQAHR